MPAWAGDALLPGVGMLKKLAAALIHVVMLAVVCAIAAYWGVRILTPLPTAAPPPVAATPPREPDPVLAARMFGLVQLPAQARVASNIQVAGIFAAGKDSSAVLTVDGKPPRAFVLGQDVAPGTRLVEVKPDTVVVESAAGRQELRAPPRPAASLATGAPARAYVLDGGALSAPASSAGAGPSAAPVAMPTRPVAPQPMPQPMPMQQPMPPPVQPTPGVPQDALVPGQQPEQAPPQR